MVPTHLTILYFLSYINKYIVEKFLCDIRNVKVCNVTWMYITQKGSFENNVQLSRLKHKRTFLFEMFFLLEILSLNIKV